MSLSKDVQLKKLNCLHIFNLLRTKVERNTDAIDFKEIRFFEMRSTHYNNVR